MFNIFKKNTAVSRLIEERLYEQVAEEITTGKLRTGLWTKALANAEGNNEKAEGIYIKLRIQSLKDEQELIKPAANPKPQRLSAFEYGLSKEDIEYLGQPIQAVDHISKYGSSEKSINKAISEAKIRGVIHKGVLWVQDIKI
jgi:hypothetical protein